MIQLQLDNLLCDYIVLWSVEYVNPNNISDQSVYTSKPFDIRVSLSINPWPVGGAGGVHWKLTVMLVGKFGKIETKCAKYPLTASEDNGL